MLDSLRRLVAKLIDGLVEFGALLVSPIERVVAAVTRTFFSAAEGAEGFFDQAGSWLFWPFRMLGRAVAALGRLCLPEAVREALANFMGGLSAVPARLLNALLHASEALNLDRPVLWLIWLLQPLWRPIAALGGFLYGWFVTRQWFAMRWGLPALVLLLPLALMSGYSWWIGNGAVISRYQADVKAALASQDYERAQLFERKLAQLGVDTELTEYRTALALAEEEKLEQAFERMQLLAPEDRPGYPSAHYWMVQQLMSGKLVQAELLADNDESRRLAKIHLDHLETLEIASEYLQYLRALWLAQGNQLAEAATVLEPLVAIMPNAAFESMRIHLALENTDRARRDARTLVTHMTTQVQRSAQLQPADYQQWLAAEEVLGNLKQMRTLLDEWIAIEPDSPEVQKALATVCRREAAQMLRDPLPDPKQIVELWLRAAELDQADDSLSSLVGTLYRDRDLQPIYEKVLVALRESPLTPSALLVAVGTEAAIAEQYLDAREFLAVAVERDDTNPVAWNNYGLVLSEGEDAQLEEALTAVNRALAIAPNEHRFRETRGQILLKLGRWQQAVDDLEFALNGLPDLAAIHVSLAKAYEALGSEELAELHRGQAN